MEAYLPILNILVPQVAQVPVVAGLPFFIVMAVGFFISFFALHLTQYASILLSPLSLARAFSPSFAIPARIPSCRRMNQTKFYRYFYG